MPSERQFWVTRVGGKCATGFTGVESTFRKNLTGVGLKTRRKGVFETVNGRELGWVNLNGEDGDRGTEVKTVEGKRQIEEDPAPHAVIRSTPSRCADVKSPKEG